MFDTMYRHPRANHMLFQPLNVDSTTTQLFSSYCPFLQLLRFVGLASQNGGVQILSML